MTDNNGFKMFNNYYAEWVEDLTNEQLGEIVRYLFIYNIYGETPTFEKENLVLKVIFGMVKSHIDASNKKRSVNINNGKNGGAPLGNNNARKQPNSTENNPKTTQKQPKTNNIDIDTDIDIDIDIEKDKEIILKENKKEKITRHKYGQYSNVLLSDEEMEKLINEFPNDYSDRIERLSEYMASTGKSYKSHLATIRNWAKRDMENSKKSSDGWDYINSVARGGAL